MTSHSYALPLPVAALSESGHSRSPTPAFAAVASEVVGKALEVLALPFRTWYRAAVIGQSIRELGSIDARLLQDVAGNRSPAACATLIATARNDRELPRHDI